MIFLGILLSFAAIGFLCWLLFTLAVYALPFFAGVSLGMWAYGTGAGWLGAIIVGLVAAARGEDGHQAHDRQRSEQAGCTSLHQVTFWASRKAR